MPMLNSNISKSVKRCLCSSWTSQPFSPTLLCTAQGFHSAGSGPLQRMQATCARACAESQDEQGPCCRWEPGCAHLHGKDEVSVSCIEELFSPLLCQEGLWERRHEIGVDELQDDLHDWCGHIGDLHSRQAACLLACLRAICNTKLVRQCRCPACM